MLQRAMTESGLWHPHGTTDTPFILFLSGVAVRDIRADGRVSHIQTLTSLKYLYIVCLAALHGRVCGLEGQSASPLRVPYYRLVRLPHTSPRVFLFVGHIIFTLPLVFQARCTRPRSLLAALCHRETTQIYVYRGAIQHHGIVTHVPPAQGGSETSAASADAPLLSPLYVHVVHFDSACDGVETTNLETFLKVRVAALE